MDKITEIVSKTTNSYFGLYFTGSTVTRSGDWAVLADDKKSLDYISIQDVYDRCTQSNYRGQIWCSLDGAATGMWVTTMMKDYQKFQKTFNNILVDSCTDQFGQSEWLIYVTRLVKPEQTLWVYNRPHAFNMHFPCVVWPNQERTNIPQYSLFRWFDKSTNKKLEPGRDVCIDLED